MQKQHFDEVFTSYEAFTHCMEKQLNIFSKTQKPKAKSAAKKRAATDKWYIFIDGASRNNPGPAGAGIYIKYKDKTICKKGYFLGKKTNNQAEYLSLLLSLLITEQEFVKKNIEIPIAITSDSELLVKQIKGLYKVKNPELKKIKKLIDKKLKGKSFTIKHVLREKNKVADKLANKGIDSKKNPPDSFLTFFEENDIEL